MLVTLPTSVMFVLAGCSSPASTSRPERAEPIPGLPAGDERAVQRYAEDERFLVVAERELIRRCMEASGFRYIVERPTTAEVAADLDFSVGAGGDLASRRERGYGLFEANQQRRDGGAERSAVDGDAGQPQSANDAYVRSLPADQQEAYMAALVGGESAPQQIETSSGDVIEMNRDGCVNEARQQIWEDPTRWMSLLMERQAIRNDLVGRAEQDGGFQQALGAWRGCMAARGFEFRTPSAAVDALAQEYAAASDPAEVRERETAVAVADGECGESAELAAAYERALAEARNEMAPDQERVLLAEEELRREGVDRAKQLLGDL